MAHWRRQHRVSLQLDHLSVFAVGRGRGMCEFCCKNLRNNKAHQGHLTPIYELGDMPVDVFLFSVRSSFFFVSFILLPTSAYQEGKGECVRTRHALKLRTQRNNIRPRYKTRRDLFITSFSSFSSSFLRWRCATAPSLHTSS